MTDVTVEINDEFEKWAAEEFRFPKDHAAYLLARALENYKREKAYFERISREDAIRAASQSYPGSTLTSSTWPSQP